VLGRIERERGQLESELAAVQTRRLVALEMLETARAQAGSNGAAAPVLVALVTTREAQLQTADSVIRRLQLLLEGPNVERTLWELRFAGHQTENVHTLNASERRLRHLAGRLKVWHEKERQQLDVSSSQIQLAESQLQSLPLNSDLRPLSRDRLETLRERDQVMRRLVSEIERLQRFTDRVTESLQAAEDRLPFTGRVQQLFAEAGSFTTKLWDFELFAIQDTITVDGQEITGKRTVTVGKIVLAIIILGIGIWLTGGVTRLLEPVIIKRLHIEPNEARLIRRWLRAGLIAGLVIFSLVSVKIPLTVFAFAGGALAIGLGFGMQTILKNFVSGLILLFERPFRIGDILNLGPQTGTVRSIGLRASVLHLWDGTETLIPNSTLLENNVTNWTYSDRKVRFSVTVGVAYGTDVRRVMELIQAAAERHGLVQKDPAPQVLFTDFAESCLTFELRYWVDITKANGAQVSSDLRMMIAGAFAENAISIAFPQRDLHLFADRPLPVQVVSPPAAPPAPVKPTEPKPPAESKASPHLP
jgi:small-conductance mechanosensitive channel